MANALFRKKTIQQINDTEIEKHGLNKILTTRDLTALGIAAIIGAGIFSTIGKASADGGPAVIFLFLFTAVACGLAAFAYAEFASLVPVSGSAYTYSYVAFGELVAWIIGWSLIMEYGIGNITVAISWSDYFTGLLSSMNLHLPAWTTMDYLTASKGYNSVLQLMQAGKSYDSIAPALQESYQAWLNAPTIGNLHLVADLPALGIIVFITWLVYRGMQESRNASNIMVVIKLAIVLLVIAVGVFYVDTDNWSPFAPNGIPGILKGVSAVFFAYIGFDAISTTAEECKNPQRDLPRGMMWAIIICTVLYVIIALVLTGMVNYTELNVGDPLAYVFDKLDLKWLSGIIAVSAVVAMASVLLVFQLGQPRIWMSMSRDGLLPKAFSRVHPKFKTPSFATIVTGFVVAVPALFMNLTMVTDLCSIGTLFAFVLVCAGVLKLQNDPSVKRGSFRIPYANGKYIFPIMLVAACAIAYTNNWESVKGFIYNSPKAFEKEVFLDKLNAEEINSLKLQLSNGNASSAAQLDLHSELTKLDENAYLAVLSKATVADDKKMEQGWDLFRHKIPTWVFLISCVLLCIWTYKQNLSLIPLLGLVACLYMMSEMGISNWIGFGIWLLVGLLIYFSYGIKNSRLANNSVTKE